MEAVVQFEMGSYVVIQTGIWRGWRGLVIGVPTSYWINHLESAYVVDILDGPTRGFAEYELKASL